MSEEAFATPDRHAAAGPADSADQAASPAPAAFAFAVRHFRALFAALILASVFVCGYGAQLPYFYDIDEPKYCVAGYEMALTGDFARPMYNGQPRMEKPPLAYWLMAPVARAAVALGGPEAFTPFAARLPGVLASVLLVAGTVMLGVRLFGPEQGPLVGLAAGLMLECSVLFKFVAIILKVDVFFSCSVTWVAYFLASRLLGDRSARNLAWLSLWMALATLSKGPFAYLPVAAYAVALGLDKAREDASGRGFAARAWSGLWAGLWEEKGAFAATLAAGCGAFFGWIAWAWFAGGVNYLAGLMEEFNLNTTVGAGLHLVERIGKTGFYGDTIATVFYPWCAFLPGAFLFYLATFRKERPGSLYTAGLLFIYVIVFTLLFKLKAHRYFLPAAPFLSLMAAHWLLSAPRDKRWSFWFDMCSIWLACLTGFFLVRFWRGGDMPVNLYYSVPGARLFDNPVPVLIFLSVVAVGFGLASWRQSRHPVQHILILALAFVLSMPFYAQTLPLPSAEARPGHTPLLALSLKEKVRPLVQTTGGAAVLLAHSRELQLLFPDTVFFLKDVLPGPPAYTLALPIPTAQEFLTLLRDPNQGPALLAAQRENADRLPVYQTMASKRYRQAVILLTNPEFEEFRTAAAKLPPEVQARLRVDRAEGMTVKWVTDMIYLVSLGD
jgi:4-amino-4-deoxy-L-arabinose transferase-like glycosyltransferase